eukprot:m.102095 g.102095  ORF g.102095 m.102095 type:complete len:117 (-) comp51529_c0_seq4:513-863(-)
MDGVRLCDCRPYPFSALYLFCFLLCGYSLPFFLSFFSPGPSGSCSRFPFCAFLHSCAQVRLVLLHDIKNDDGIRGFFGEVYELYIKVLLNPFYTPGAPITSKDFSAKVKMVAKRHL